jgi:hypothetical protein
MSRLPIRDAQSMALINDLRDKNQKLKTRIAELQELMTHQWHRFGPGAPNRICHNCGKRKIEYWTGIEIGSVTWHIVGCEPCIQESSR